MRNVRFRAERQGPLPTPVGPHEQVRSAEFGPLVVARSPPRRLPNTLGLCGKRKWLNLFQVVILG